jgi:hypothetical protein
MTAFIFVLGLLIVLIAGGMCIAFYLYRHGAVGNRFGVSVQRVHNADGSDMVDEDEYAA